MAFEHRPVARATAEIVRNECNPRTHSEAHVAQIVLSIKEFGFTNPILIDETNLIVAGEGRFLAAQKLAMVTVPCVVLAGLSKAQKAAYAIADKKLALNSSWDEEMLRSELERIGGLDFDVLLTGFSEVEIIEVCGDVDADLGAYAPVQDPTGSDTTPEAEDGGYTGMPFVVRLLLRHIERRVAALGSCLRAGTHSPKVPKLTRTFWCLRLFVLSSECSNVPGSRERLAPQSWRRARDAGSSGQ